MIYAGVVETKMTTLYITSIFQMNSQLAPYTTVIMPKLEASYELQTYLHVVEQQQ